jgi:hypothetical protein
MRSQRCAQGDLHMAIEYYHKALGLSPRDTFTNDLLPKALESVTLSDRIG